MAAALRIPLLFSLLFALALGLAAQPVPKGDDLRAKSPLLKMGMLRSYGSESAHEQYCNSRFMFCMDFARDVFANRIYADNEDGITLISISGDTEMSVYGYNRLDWSLQEVHAFFLEDVSQETGSAAMDVSVLPGDGWFETRASTEDYLYFQKTLDRGNDFVSIVVRSKQSDAATFRQVIGTLSTNVQ